MGTPRTFTIQGYAARNRVPAARPHTDQGWSTMNTDKVEDVD